MSDEEKKAIQELTEIKELVEEDLKYDDYEVTATLDQIDLKSLVIVLNLIEKQQKEIDHWKKGIEIVDKDHKNYINKQYNKILEKEEIIEKQNKIIDKIKEKIEEYEEILDSPIIKEDYKKEVEHIIRVLKELRGDN